MHWLLAQKIFAQVEIMQYPIECLRTKYKDSVIYSVIYKVIFLKNV